MKNGRTNLWMAKRFLKYLAIFPCTYLNSVCVTYSHVNFGSHNIILLGKLRIYCIPSKYLRGKLLQLEILIHGKTFMVAASFNNKCLIK